MLGAEGPFLWCPLIGALLHQHVVLNGRVAVHVHHVLVGQVHILVAVEFHLQTEKANKFNVKPEKTFNNVFNTQQTGREQQCSIHPSRVSLSQAHMSFSSSHIDVLDCWRKLHREKLVRNQTCDPPAARKQITSVSPTTFLKSVL